MTERMLELARQAGLKKDHGSDREYLGDFDWREFAELIAKECMDCSTWVGTVNKNSVEPIHTSMAINKRIKKQFGIGEAVTRRLMGYAEREEGYYPMYEPEPGSIVTQAFILCKYCNGAIYHCTGPRYDAVCLTCYEKDTDLR